MKIWLDAGHGGNDPGASAFGVLEKNWTLDIDHRIAEILKHNKIAFERTRVSDVTVSPSVRAARVRNSGANYCISSHINAGGGKGAETIHSIYAKDGMRLAEIILDELGKIGLTKRRFYSRAGANGDYYFMHRETGPVTTIIVEYGFIDHETDHHFLSQGTNRQKCAEAVVKGICRHAGIKFQPLENDNDESNNNHQDQGILRMGDRGKQVEELQKNLMKLGYTFEKYGADGIFGEETKDVVVKFQKDYHLQVDGIVGPETLGKIQELLVASPQKTLYRVVVDDIQVGAFEQHSNIIHQVEGNLGKANRILIEKI